MNEELNKVAYDFVHGTNFSMGIFNLIEEKVRAGNDVEIRNYVELRKGTIIGARAGGGGGHERSLRLH